MAKRKTTSSAIKRGKQPTAKPTKCTMKSRGCNNHTRRVADSSDDITSSEEDVVQARPHKKARPTVEVREADESEEDPEVLEESDLDEPEETTAETNNEVSK
jgi:hypothetical protein